MEELVHWNISKMKSKQTVKVSTTGNGNNPTGNPMSGLTCCTIPCLRVVPKELMKGITRI